MTDDRPRVLVTETIADAGIALLTDARIDVDVRTDLSPGDLVEAIGPYDGLIVRSATKVVREVVEAGDRLKVVGRAGIGVDNVDVDAATRRGILVVNAPQSNVIAAAEHTMALLLALMRKIPPAHQALMGGHWQRERFMGTELHSKTLGIIGLGRVGTLVAQRATAFGMKVIACDPYVSQQRAAQLGIDLLPQDDPPKPPLELLRRSDVVSIHITKTPENVHLIGEAELAQCKEGVYIVNTARGGLVDEEALAREIKAGKVAGAAFDVFETEPASTSPLFGLEEVVVTPHLGASTVEAQDKAGVIIAEQVLLALRGEFVPNAVNLEAGRELPEFVRPFLELATKLGRLVAALAGETVGSLGVSYHGQIAEEDTRVLTLSALRGFLQGAVHEPVTYVNAPVLASERGIEYSEMRSAKPADYTNLVRLTAQRDGRTVTVAGTLAGRGNEPRLVEIDEVAIEVSLTPHMAFFRYQDRPGVVHKLTGVLAAHDINIAFMQVGRRGEGEEAIMALAVDSAIPSGVFREAVDAAGISSGRFVSLEGE